MYPGLQPWNGLVESHAAGGCHLDPVTVQNIAELLLQVAGV